MHGVWPVELELRQGGRELRGTFPYGALATIRDRGRTRKERFASDSAGWQLREFARLQAELGTLLQGAIDEVLGEVRELRQVETPAIAAKRAELAARNVDLLYGHDFNRPIASMLAGSLTVTSDDAALRFTATLPPDGERPSWMEDAVRAVRSGLVRGISPGFRVPPRDVVPNGEELIPEPGNPGVMIRQINQALIPELSLVTRPAYVDSAVDLRHGDAGGDGPTAGTLWL